MRLSLPNLGHRAWYGDYWMVRGSKALKLDGHFTPLIVELMAILEGLLVAIECRYRTFAMENDSINAIAMVNSACGLSSSN
ncbi:hypothetical protein PanWU01x14_170840 [Parasponia andersonii]|uniref:RNase H type-1 domain-containing protein n=1 Tax=Parasponia andersonii TaxID=3476 RepID=A0A2P5CA19_PARAD|nr:hypothetical protein PanWU01x14_170840 [Parasponia andersonii]